MLLNKFKTIKIIECLKGFIFNQGLKCDFNYSRNNNPNTPFIQTLIT